MDRTSSISKLKKAFSGKAGLGLSFVAVAGFAMAVGMRMGDKPAPAQPAHPVREAAHASAHGDLHAAHAQAHKDEAHKKEEIDEERLAEKVAMSDAGSSEGEESAPAAAAVLEDHRGWSDRIFGTYAAAWRSVQDKVDAISHAETDNERLRLENTHLRLALEGMQFNCSAKAASDKTHEIEYKLDKQTGSLVGRDLASIAYRVPTNLVPGQLYTLGISYFKGREDEKAAVIFTFLTGLDDNDIFKTPKNFLLTGIAWYRLDNFATAERYFDRALKAPESPENLQTLAHARLWKALTATRMGKHTQSQFWLTELIDHSPLSQEATWVNPRRGARVPASNHQPQEGAPAQHEGERHSPK
jgi:hypothetical protein